MTDKDLYKNLYKNCRLCERRCGVDRTSSKKGFCASDSIPAIARADLHFWEEPVISGDRGSGTVFFSGCSLGCIYCQNREISRRQVGNKRDAEALCEIMLDLESRGAHNINLVTPTHFVPTIIESVSLAKSRGLSLPIVYNTASYETEQTLDMLDGVVDVYLADYKYFRNDLAKKYSNAENYPEVAFKAIEKMVRQQPMPVLKDGILQKGVIVRFLLLPGHLAQTKLALKKIYSAFGDDIFISLMSQYTPMENMPSPLNRRVINAEYNELLEYADKLGVVNGFTQKNDSAGKSYIPQFDVRF